VDLVKEDSCYATSDHHQAFLQYAAMRDALNATGRPIYFSLCGWYNWYSPVGNILGNGWRIAGDVVNWDQVLVAINTNANLSWNAGPGFWNDPDILLGSTAGGSVILTQTQSRTMFSMW
jgi:alpha-galactosidase